MRESLLIGRAAVCVALVCLLASVYGCSSEVAKGRASPTYATTAASAGAPADDNPGKLGFEGNHGKLGFELANFTGTTLRAVYLSPNDSGGWEENVIGTDELTDGESIELRFSPEERAASWDLKVEGVDGHSAEWKGLRLRDVSRVTLHLDVIGERVVVAEVE